MPTARINFHVLDVGQGACNYVEIIDEDEAVTHNMLIDLGTNSSQTIATKNLEWLRNKIIANHHYLDVLVLTHGDTDHYNMIAKILPAFGAPNHTQIGMTRYGGPSWRYKHGQLITTLAGYTQLIDGEDLDSANIGGFEPSDTGFFPGEDPEWYPIWVDDESEDSPKLQLIIANTAHPHDPANMAVKQQRMNAEAVNTKSVVLGLEWDGHWIVATGDATSTTLEVINGFINEGDEDLPKTFMMTLPHHGSRKTTYDLVAANNMPTNKARKTVDDFLNIFNPFTMSISAGVKKHHHPSAYMIEQFAGHLNHDKPAYWSDPACTGNRHFLTSWVDQAITANGFNPAWPVNWQYATTQTRNAMFSTLYFSDQQYNANRAPRYIFPPNQGAGVGSADRVDDIPRGRNWEFSMDEEALHVDSEENPARAQAERADFMAAIAASPSSVVTAAGRASRANLTAPVVTQRQDDPPSRLSDSGAPSLRGLRATE